MHNLCRHRIWEATGRLERRLARVARIRANQWCCGRVASIVCVCFFFVLDDRGFSFTLSTFQLSTCFSHHIISFLSLVCAEGRFLSFLFSCFCHLGLWGRQAYWAGFNMGAALLDCFFFLLVDGGGWIFFFFSMANVHGYREGLRSKKYFTISCAKHTQIPHPPPAIHALVITRCPAKPASESFAFPQRKKRHDIASHLYHHHHHHHLHYHNPTPLHTTHTPGIHKMPPRQIPASRRAGPPQQQPGFATSLYREFWSYENAALIKSVALFAVRHLG